MFRGNVQTRLRKLEEGQVDGTLLAYAGLRRLGLADIVTEVLDMDRFLPAPGQGAICIECRADDAAARHMLDAIADRQTEAALLCERAFLAALDGDCKTPIAAHATVENDAIFMTGMILTPDGKSWHRIQGRGTVSEAAALGQWLGGDIRAKAGPEFFESWA
jgi:hydroxymethylbilane synthase